MENKLYKLELFQEGINSPLQTWEKLTDDMVIEEIEKYILRWLKHFNAVTLSLPTYEYYRRLGAKYVRLIIKYSKYGKYQHTMYFVTTKMENSND